MKLFIYISLMMSSLFCLTFDRISVDPVFYIDHESEGYMWQPEFNESISRGGWGINYSYVNDFFTIEGRFINNRFFGLDKTPTDFSFQQGLSWTQNATENKNFDFDFTDLKVTYKREKSIISFGKSSFNITEGHRSIIMSNKVPSFPFISYDWQINNDLSFKYIHGSLKSMIQDNSMQEFYEQVSSKDFYILRNFSYHSLEYRATDRIDILFAELGING